MAVEPRARLPPQPRCLTHRLAHMQHTLSAQLLALFEGHRGITERYVSARDPAWPPLEAIDSTTNTAAECTAYREWQMRRQFQQSERQEAFKLAHFSYPMALLQAFTKIIFYVVAQCIANLWVLKTEFYVSA